MVRRKTWREKLADSKDLPKVVQLKPNAQKRWKGNSMAIPSPREVNDIMASVPRGKLTTINEVRKMIAQKHKADIGCPLTCGIFSWIAANAAVEAAAAGGKNTTPYWRTLKSNGELNPKYPGGIAEQRKNLESEGFRVVRKGKKYVVDCYDKHLMKR
jgi:alkylated DNA nucleotide flippase Atl1